MGLERTLKALVPQIVMCLAHPASPCLVSFPNSVSHPYRDGIVNIAEELGKPSAGCNEEPGPEEVASWLRA